MAASASSSPSSALESIARAGGERGVPSVGLGRRAGNCESGSWRSGVQGASKPSILPRHAATPLTVGPHWRRPRRPLWIATQRPPGPPGPPAHPPPLSVSGRRRQPTCRLGCPGWPCVWRRRGGTLKEGGNTNAGQQACCMSEAQWPCPPWQGLGLERPTVAGVTYFVSLAPKSSWGK